MHSFKFVLWEADFMQKKTEKAIAILLAIGIICFLAFYLLQSYGTYKFEYVKENVSFVSNEAEPADLMREFNLNDTVFVSPALFDQGAGNNFVSSAFNLVQIVFIGNDKNAVSLWRVIDKNGMISYCRTNNGDISKDIELSAAECLVILNDKNNAVLLISMPTNEKKSKIVFSKNRIEIVPEKTDSVTNVSFTFLKAMYANAELIILKTNKFTEFVK